VKITVTPEIGKPYATNVARAAGSCLNELTARARSPVALKEISIVIVGDRRMSALHKTFMNIAGPTDVLTFPIDEDSRGNVTSGEIYICLPEAKRQAKSLGIPVKNELLLYAIHGILHLLDYDDRTDRGYRAMHLLEDQLLTQLGVGPVFSPAGAGIRAKPQAARPRKGMRA
jgi:probable rRNA maturation factor